MHREISPIPVRPWTLNGLSERLIVSHYENNYGGAVRTLNAIRSELHGLDAAAPGYRMRALKREELSAMGSVALHELYFGNLGGEGHKIPAQAGTTLEEAPMTYVAQGWAQQRDVQGEFVTIFHLALNYLGPRNARRSATDAEHPVPFAVRIVVNETSGDVTLAKRAVTPMAGL